jgi:hypothetical protein
MTMAFDTGVCDSAAAPARSALAPGSSGLTARWFRLCWWGFRTTRSYLRLQTAGAGNSATIEVDVHFRARQLQFG